MYTEKDFDDDKSTFMASVQNSDLKQPSKVFAAILAQVVSYEALLVVFKKLNEEKEH